MKVSQEEVMKEFNSFPPTCPMCGGETRSASDLVNACLVLRCIECGESFAVSDRDWKTRGLGWVSDEWRRVAEDRRALPG